MGGLITHPRDNISYDRRPMNAKVCGPLISVSRLPDLTIHHYWTDVDAQGLAGLVCSAMMDMSYAPVTN
jgi:hypothetical protein